MFFLAGPDRFLGRPSSFSQTLRNQGFIVTLHAGETSGVYLKYRVSRVRVHVKGMAGF